MKQNTDLGRIPRTLVISHTAFSSTNNMGKTMMDMLSCVPSENLAQLYFRSGAPTQYACERYFRISDKDVLQSVFTRKNRFQIYEKEDIRTDCSDSQTDTGISGRIYQFSRRRTPLIYLMRNALWSIGKWDSPELDAWIKDFAPELIFFAAGDYAFAYKIVCRLSERYGLPVIMWCADDHYIARKKTLSPLYHYVCHNRMKWARRTVARSRHIITISDKMQKDYAKLFGIPATTMRISAQENRFMRPADEREGIVYAGNLGVNRINPLVKVGRELKTAGIPGYEYINVYSADKNKKTLKQLTQANGIRFHGAVNRERLEQILGSAKFLLYTEAFDEKSKVRTRYSLSTKVGEYLKSGACIVVYGPMDISSVEYLFENDVALVLRNANDVKEGLRRLLNDPKSYDVMQNRTKELANRKHCKQENDKTILSILTQIKESERMNDE